MKVALDSNVLVYSAGILKVEADREKKLRIRQIIDEMDKRATIVCPMQTFGEAYFVMQRAGRSREKCREMLRQWADRFETVGSSPDAFLRAIDLATDHQWQFWDALIVNAAADAESQLLLSEDLQAGFTWRGVTVVNPFAAEMDRRLARLLTD